MPSYEFESIPVVRTREGRRLSRDHRELILARASAGWKLVQMTDFSGYVDPHLELIFTKE